MSERYYVNVSSLAELSPGDYVVHPVIGGFKVARNWQPSYDREVKAAGWDEGFARGIAYQAGLNDAWVNPYRIESEARP